LLKNARADASKKQKVVALPKDAALISAESLNSSVERLNAVAFVLCHAKSSGAELLPFGSDLKKATEFHKNLLGDGSSADDLSLVRLLEGSVAELYLRYVEKSNSGVNYPVLAESAFLDVFEHDPRLQHVKTARKRASFSKCDVCSDYTTFCHNHYADPAAVEARKAHQTQHILLVAAERMVATVDGQSTVLDKERGRNQIPRTVHIDVAVVILFDKMTQHATTIPSLHPAPKCLNATSRLA